MSPEADLRPRLSMHTHNREIEKTSDQANQFNINNILYSMDRTLAQPLVILNLLRRNSLKFQPPSVHVHVYTLLILLLLFLSLCTVQSP
jgi:hypothetical protein